MECTFSGMAVLAVLGFLCCAQLLLHGGGGGRRGRRGVFGQRHVPPDAKGNKVIAAALCAREALSNAVLPWSDRS